MVARLQPYPELEWLGIEPPPELRLDGNILVQSGAFPSWPITDMLTWVPTPVQRLGTHAIGLDYEGLEIPTSAEQDVLAAFATAGYACARNQYLIEISCNLASGRPPVHLVD